MLNLHNDSRPERLSEEDLARFRARVEGDFYEEPSVLDELVGRLIGSGDLLVDPSALGSWDE